MHARSIPRNAEEHLKYLDSLLLSSHFSCPLFLLLKLDPPSLLILLKTTMPLLLLLFNLFPLNIYLFNCLSLLPPLFISICLQTLLRDWLPFLHFFLCVVEAVVVVVAVAMVVISFLYGMLIKSQLFILLYDFFSAFNFNELIEFKYV